VATRKRKEKGPSETQLQTEILDVLNSNGFRAIRINSGLARGLYGGVIHLAPKGTPDILIQHPYGWVEVKRPGEKLNDDQQTWHDWAVENDVPHTIANSAESALAFARSLPW
jgi:hypothetical protein